MASRLNDWHDLTIKGETYMTHEDEPIPLLEIRRRVMDLISEVCDMKIKVSGCTKDLENALMSLDYSEAKLKSYEEMFKVAQKHYKYFKGDEKINAHKEAAEEKLKDHARTQEEGWPS